MDDGHTGLQLSPAERPFLSLLIGLAPAPVNLVFDSTRYKEYGKHKWHTDENDAPFGYPTHDANAGGEPSAGCRCQSMDVFGSPFRRLRNPRENLDSISYGSGIRTRSLWKRGVGFLGGRLLFLECLIYRLDRIVAENPPYQFATVP
jgi:hypothetical protein